jgi:hypothetical protein
VGDAAVVVLVVVMSLVISWAAFGVISGVIARNKGLSAVNYLDCRLSARPD